MFISSTVSCFGDLSRNFRGHGRSPIFPVPLPSWRIHGTQEWENSEKSPWPHQPRFLNHRFPHDSLQIRFFSTRLLGSLQMLPASTSLCGRKHSQDPVGIAECLFVVKVNKKVTGTSNCCLGCHYACFIQYYSSTKSQTN